MLEITSLLFGLSSLLLSHRLVSFNIYPFLYETKFNLYNDFNKSELLRPFLWRYSTCLSLIADV